MRVSAVDVAHRFPGTDILFEHLSFTVEPGEVVALCGPSGCGKSTLLSILAGWEKPWAGHIEREGIGKVGWVFQNPYGVANRTALDHVAFPLLAKGLGRGEAEERAMRTLELFGLGDVADRPFAALSGGEAQRLMLARAVCVRPDMLLVDEPTAQLDTRTAETVSHVLGNLAGQGMIVFVATHDPRTRDACDRVIDLADYAPPEGESEEESESSETADNGARPHSSAAAPSPEELALGDIQTTGDLSLPVAAPGGRGGAREGSRTENGAKPHQMPHAKTETPRGGTGETVTGEGLGAVAVPRRMRLRSIFSEAHRNLSLGVSRALIFMLILLSASTLLGGYDATTVIGLQNQAVARVSTLADARDILGGTVDAVACDRLSEDQTAVRESGALRSDDSLTPLPTPRQQVPVYQVTDGMIRLIADSQHDAAIRSDASGAWVSRELADLFGLEKGSILATDRGTVSIAGVYQWPNDGRDTRFAFAFLIPSSASDGTYQECWAEQWPYDDQLDGLLYTVLVADPAGSSAGVMPVNNGFGDWDAEASYQTRTTRITPWIGLAVGVVCGAISVIRRRLEYAGALHAGQSKGAQLLGIALETLAWAGLASLAAGALLAGMCARLAPAGWLLIALQTLRVPLAVFAGTLAAALLFGLFLRESRLLRYFKNR